MTVDAQQRTFAAARKRLADPRTAQIVSRKETKIAGRDAIRFETEQTQDLLYPAGTMRYGYLVDHDGRAFMVQTFSIPGAGSDYERNKKIVDQAARTVEFDI